MLRIDGSQGEGGGQLLRSSLAFSALTGQAFRLENIRANRNKPGLRPQHLAAVRLAAQLCGARCQGDEINSGTLEFHPGPLRPGHFRQEIGTAGSLVLLTQAALIPALRAGGPVVLELHGGTDVPMAPPLDYVAEVVLPYYRRLGKIELEVVRRGFHPQGGGCLRLAVEGHAEPALPLNLVGPSRWDKVKGLAVASAHLGDAQVGQRMSRSAQDRLSGSLVEESHVLSDSPGAVLTLWCEDVARERRTGASTLGRPGLSSEKVGKQAATAMRRILDDPRPVDEHLADQLVPLLALLGGQMECQTISGHCSTNIDICSLFSGTRFELDGSTIRAAL